MICKGLRKKTINKDGTRYLIQYNGIGKIIAGTRQISIIYYLWPIDIHEDII